MKNAFVFVLSALLTLAVFFSAVGAGTGGMSPADIPPGETAAEENETAVTAAETNAVVPGIDAPMQKGHIETEAVTEARTGAESSRTEKAAAWSNKNEKTVTDVNPSSAAGLFSSAESTKTDSAIAFGREYQGVISDYDDCAEFTFTCAGRGTVRYSFAHAEYKGTGGFDVRLEYEYYKDGSSGDTAWRVINELKSAGSEKVLNSPEIGVLPGNYRITVQPDGIPVDEPFSIKTEFTARNDYETECNDSKTRYTELYAGESISGSASYFEDRSDTDWYMLRMYDSGIIRLKFAHETENTPSVCWRVCLYGADGTLLYSENSSFATECTDSGRLGLSKGVYYIAVYSRVYASHTYTLTAERMKTAVYEKEYNDTPENATAVSLNTAVYGVMSSRQGGADRDYYKFIVEGQGLAIVTFGHDPVEYEDDRRGWTIRLFDSAGTVLYAGEGLYSTEKISSLPTGISPGEYYIEVACDNCYRNSADYSVELGFALSPDVETEPNNTHEAADMLTAGKTVSGTITENVSDYDSDYFSAVKHGEGKLTISFGLSETDKEKEYFRIYLYDEKLTPVTLYLTDGSFREDFVPVVCDTGEVTASAVVPDGKYYIKITAGDFHSTGIYNLTYTEEITK